MRELRASARAIRRGTDVGVAGPLGTAASHIGKLTGAISTEELPLSSSELTADTQRRRRLQQPNPLERSASPDYCTAAAASLTACALPIPL